MSLLQKAAGLVPPQLREWGTASHNARALRRSRTLADVADGKLFPQRSDEQHIGEILAWMQWGIAASSDGGLPQLVALRPYADTGSIRIAPSYPETTGYSLCSVVLGHRAGLPTLPVAAMTRMKDYLLGTQLPSGAFPGPGEMANVPLAFDTGQILKGLVAYHRHVEKSPELQRSIESAASWLASSIDADGSYSTAASYSGKRCYYLEASVGLMQAGLAFGRSEWCDAAARTADWVLRQRVGTSWFRNFSFEDGSFQNLHGIAYTLRGLLDIGRHLDRQDFIDAALVSLRALVKEPGSYRDLPLAGALPGYFGPQFDRYQRNISPTGMAQTALCCRVAGALTGDERLSERGAQLTQSLKSLHFTGFDEPALNGLLPGSWPVTGPYMRCALPNWAAKYFLDCLYLASGADPEWLEG